jgi:hypothetical protein
MLFDLSFVKIRPLRYRQQREAMSLGTDVGYPESLGRKARHSTNNRAPNPPNYDSGSAASEFFPRPDEFLRGTAPYLSTTTPEVYDR